MSWNSVVPLATNGPSAAHVVGEHGRAEHDDDVVRRELLARAVAAPA